MTSGTRETVSACLIVRDEAERIGPCLESVAFCDEIVVVDSGSVDGTRELARTAGARVVENPWPGFAVQRNVAMDAASGDWVLEIDADERVTAELREEIVRFLAAPPDGVDIAAMPRRNIFLGAPLGPAAKYPEYRTRLFRRGAYRHDESRAVHERHLPRGPVWPFTGDLEHVLAGSWQEALADTRRYSELETHHLPASPSARAYAMGMVARPAAKAAYRLVLYGGWRDGWRGALRIGMDSLSDMSVWARRLTRGAGAADQENGTPLSGHFAPPKLYVGPVRVVALAGGAAAAATAAGWLARARDAGADVALVTDCPAAAGEGVRARAVDRLLPVAAIRALEAEEQLRPIDALVPIGARAARVARLVPPNLRGRAGSIDDRLDPPEAVRAVRAATRP